jgi:hypothetical protein
MGSGPECPGAGTGYVRDMPSLISKITRFASSPQGRRLTAQAKRYASDPKNRAKIDDARRRLMERNKQR